MIAPGTTVRGAFSFHCTDTLIVTQQRKYTETTEYTETSFATDDTD